MQWQYLVPTFPSFPPSPGDVINLGDRQLTVLHMPGHSRGSICLHDKENKMLFSGDVVYDGSMIDWLPLQPDQRLHSSCERLVEMVIKRRLTRSCLAIITLLVAKRLHRLASNYIASAGACHRASTCLVKSIAAWHFEPPTREVPASSYEKDYYATTSLQTSIYENTEEYSVLMIYRIQFDSIICDQGSKYIKKCCIISIKSFKNNSRHCHILKVLFVIFNDNV